MKEKSKNNLSKPLVLNLNTYSYYSLLSSSLSLDQIINFAIEENKKYVCLTDTNLYGAIEFYIKCKKNNLIPIIGLCINSELIENTQHDFVLFAKNKKGYLNLVKISSFLMTNTSFNFEDYLDNLFIVDKNKTFNFKTKSNIYYLDKDHEKAIAFNEARYLRREDKRIYNALLCIKNNRTTSVEELEIGPNLRLLTEQDSLNLFNEKQISNLNNEIQDIDLEIEFEKNNIIKYPNDSEINDKQLLYKFCLNGLNEKIFNKEIDSSLKNDYIERMEYELEIINNMGFNDYFLVVQDFIKEAKNNNILIGPGRGSAAGSLVAYLLGITEIDSIKYNLLFERFLNPGRQTMPDIDIDIMDIRRDEVVDYLFNKYGYDHVAHIVTFQKIKTKMALRDIGRILDIDLKVVNAICKSISKEYEEDLQSGITSKKIADAYKNYQNLFDLAIGIIGNPRQTGIHAAGIVLSQKPLTEIAPIQTSVNGEVTTQYSMDYLEDLGLIKMDLLGLTNLSTINHVCKLIKMNYNIDINLNKINLEDEKVFEDVQKGYTLGIFQLESDGMTSVVKQVKPKSIEDISICSALFRPGPMQNIKPFVRRREGLEKVEYIDPKNKDILESTYGIIVYQEQVIALVKKIANFSLAEADTFRRIISKKKEKELVKFKKLFFDNAIKNGYSKDELEKIYNYIYTFADYGFNHSHSVAYSLISYWMLYLKHYYPIDFMIILMNFSENDKNKIGAYINECERLNIKVKKPTINLSSKSFGLYKKNTIIFGLNSIKGIGSETSKKIIEVRNNSKNKKFSDFCEAIKNLSINRVGIATLETLIYAGCFDEFNLSRKYMLTNLPIIVEATNNLKDDGSFVFLRLVDVKEPTNVKNLQYLEKEIELLGIDLNNKNDFDNQEELLKRYSDIKSFTSVSTNDWFNNIVIFKSFEIRKTKKNTDMISVNLVDIFNNKKRVSSFSAKVIKAFETIDLSKKYLAVFKMSDFGPNLMSIKEEVE